MPVMKHVFPLEAEPVLAPENVCTVQADGEVASGGERNARIFDNLLRERKMLLAIARSLTRNLGLACCILLGI